MENSKIINLEFCVQARVANARVQGKQTHFINVVKKPSTRAFVTRATETNTLNKCCQKNLSFASKAGKIQSHCERARTAYFKTPKL